MRPLAADHHRRIRSLLVGSLAGIASTAVMSVPIVIGDRVGLIDRMPPEVVHDQVIERATEETDVAPPANAAVWTVSHLAYGAVCGALYEAIPGSLRPDRLVTGVLYGLIVWAVGYLGYLPALHLYPSVKRDSGTRSAIMIGAHILFGGTLAGLTSLRRRA